MNRSIIVALISIIMTYNVGMAQDNRIKEKVRTEYLSFLKEEGFSPTVDPDGDIKFKIEGNTHYIIIYDEDSPQYINLMTSGFQVGGEDGYDREISLKAANEVNRLKRTVKLCVIESSVSVRIEMPFANTESFKHVFYKLISYLATGRESFIDEYKKLSQQINTSISVDDILSSVK